MPTRDLRLLEHMIRLNALHFGMEPHLRDTRQFAEIARVATEIERLGNDTVFMNWPKEPGFPHAPERYERFRQDLIQGAKDVRAAAEAGNTAQISQAYARMDASCTACHKRYSPTY